MNRKDNEQIGLYHGYLNAIHAYLQGFYSRVNVWKVLVPEMDPGVELTELAIALEKVTNLYKGLWNGQVIDLVSEAESDDVKFLFSITQAALYYFDNAPGRVLHLLKSNPKTVSEEFVGELIGFHADQVYSRQHFVKGLVSYGNVYSLPEVADRWMQHIPISQREIQEVNSFYALAKDKKKTALELFVPLRERALLLPGIMRCKAVDIRNLEAVRMKREGYEVYGLSPEEGELWKAIGFIPLQAAYWRSYSFKPQQAEIWFKSGFRAPAHAASYGMRGINLADAVKWASLQVPAAQAIAHQLKGQTPEGYQSSQEDQETEESGRVNEKVDPSP